MLRMSGQPFFFGYVSFQNGMHRTPEFQTLSRWGQVPVLVEDERAYVQSAAIVEHLSESLDRFKGPDPLARQAVREWLFCDVDALFPAVFGCYAAELDRKKLLPLNVDPAVAAYRRHGAEAALSSLEMRFGPNLFLCAPVLTIADIFCLGDIAFGGVWIRSQRVAEGRRVDAPPQIAVWLRRAF